MSAGPRLPEHGESWAGRRAVVLGYGAGGHAVADALQHLGAETAVFGQSPAGPEWPERARLLEVLGVDLRLGEKPEDARFDQADLVVVAADEPQWSVPWAARAAGRGVTVWGEAEFAWRLRAPDAPAWLAVAGSRGVATTARLVQAIARAEGLSCDVAGSRNRPLPEAVMDPQPCDVLVVEASAALAAGMASVSCRAAVVLDVAPGERDTGIGRVYENAQIACVYNAADAATEALVAEADVIEGCRAIGFTLGMPGLSMIGLVEDIIADRAFVVDRHSNAAELGTTGDLERDGRAATPDLVECALAAAALARAHGVSQRAVRDGLRTALLPAAP
ncbi:MAG: hypothetical protein QM597_02520 [Aeromicrobium sp.]|uniref:hypothetical protein n=1 Tax=Aeromicrobium sp. TaxID=1871063 RepID=UPI0039E67C7E